MGRRGSAPPFPDSVAAVFKAQLHAYTSPRRAHHETGVAVDPATGARLPYAEHLGQVFCTLVEHIPVDALPHHGHTSPPTASPTAPAAPKTRRTAAGVKADRRSPTGPGLDTGEDRRTLTTAGTSRSPTPITCIMPRSGRSAGVCRDGERQEAVRSADDRSVLPKEMPTGAGGGARGDLRLLLGCRGASQSLAVPDIRGREA